MQGRNGRSSSRRQFRPRRDYDPTRYLDHLFLWSDTRPRRHYADGLLCDVETYHSEIAIAHFKNLRAIVSAQASIALSKSAYKHNSAFLFGIPMCSEYRTDVRSFCGIVKFWIPNLKKPRNIVGPVVRELREKLGLSQAQLAAKINVHGWDISRETLAKIEAQIRWVADFELSHLAKALEMEPTQMLKRGAENAERASHKRIC